MTKYDSGLTCYSWIGQGVQVCDKREKTINTQYNCEIIMINNTLLIYTFPICTYLWHPIHLPIEPLIGLPYVYRRSKYNIDSIHAYILCIPMNLHTIKGWVRGFKRVKKERRQLWFATIYLTLTKVPQYHWCPTTTQLHIQMLDGSEGGGAEASVWQREMTAKFNTIECKICNTPLN